MSKFMDKVKNLIFKKENSKIVKPKNALKTPVEITNNFIKRTLCFFLAATTAVLSYVKGYSIKQNNSANNAQNGLEIAHKATHISKNLCDVYDYEKNEFKVDTEALDEACKESELHEELNPIVEIALLLEKNNLTYNDLFNIINTPRYKLAFETMLERNPGLDIAKIQSILEGKNVIFRDNLFIGDSRTQGLLLSGVINEENSVYGVGYGYKWLVGDGTFRENKTNALNGAISGLEAKMEEGHKYNIVIWLGANDYRYSNANKYYQEFVYLATSKWPEHNIYIASVGPVDDSRATTVNNAGINDFNASLKELVVNSGIKNLYYLDLNIHEDEIEKYDAAGLHYGRTDYERIYNLMNSGIAENDKAKSKEVLELIYQILLDYDQNVSNRVSMEPSITRNRIKINNN